MKDGLYQVKTSYLCAGFVVKNGTVTRCAPILRKRITYWITIAAWVCSCWSALAQTTGQLAVSTEVARTQSFNGGPNVYGVTPYYYPYATCVTNDTINQANVMNAALAAAGYANQQQLNKTSRSIEENIQWLKNFRDNH